MEEGGKESRKENNLTPGQRFKALGVTVAWCQGVAYGWKLLVRRAEKAEDRDDRADEKDQRISRRGVIQDLERLLFCT